MSIRDDHEDVNRVQITTTTTTTTRRNDGGRTTVFENVRQKGTELQPAGEVDVSFCRPLVVGSCTMETQGESPKCMYHLMSPTIPANTPVDPRFSSEKPPRIRMILPELNRGTY